MQEIINKISSIVLSKYTYNLLVNKQTAVQAAETTRDQLHAQTGLSKKLCANLVRMATANYLQDEKTFTGSIKAICEEVA